MKSNKAFLEKLTTKGYGFKVAMSNFLGKYAIGSGVTGRRKARIHETPVHQKNMMDYVKANGDGVQKMSRIF